MRISAETAPSERNPKSPEEMVETLTQANHACMERQRDLIKMLGRCRQQLLLYATNHRAKNTEEGNQKAETNEGLARDIDQLLHEPLDPPTI